MTDDRSVGDQESVDSAVFDEWLAQTAESEGISKSELMDRMLSSYWILDELTELVEGTESERPSGYPSTVSPESAPEPDADSETEETDASTDPNIDRKAHSPSGHDESGDTTPTEENIREIQTAIRELIESQWAAELRRPSDDEQPDPSPPENVDTDGVSEIQERIETLASEFEDIETRQESQFERLSGELQLALDRIDELEHQQDGYADESEIAALSKEIGGLNERFEALRAATDDLESEMDREFDSIEELFGRVLDVLDDLESDIESATDSYKKELEPLQQREAERKQLEALKTEALNRGVRKGVCESCDRTLDLALLESPTCPDCAAHLIGIDDSGWNPFRPATFETENALSNRDRLQNRTE